MGHRMGLAGLVLLASWSANAQDRAVDPSAPSGPAYPTAGVGLGIGLGSLELMARVRRDRVMVEPLLAARVSITNGDVSAITTAGLDVRGLPFLAPRWEVGVIGGLAWEGAWAAFDRPNDTGGVETARSHQHGLAVRAGAGFGFRPGPKSTLGMDVIATLGRVTMTPTRVFGDPPPEQPFTPSGQLAPGFGVRLLWTFWAGPTVPVPPARG